MGRVVQIRNGVTTNTDYPKFPRPVIEGGASGSGDGDGPDGWDLNFAGNGSVKIYAEETMTINQVSLNGTGEVSYSKSTVAAPNSYNTVTLPTTVEAGAHLKITAAGASELAVHLKRID